MSPRIYKNHVLAVNGIILINVLFVDVTTMLAQSMLKYNWALS